MRTLRLAVLPLLIAASLAAQTPPPSSSTPPAAVVAPRRAAFFDVAALVDSRERFGLEPLVFGRWTVGLIGSHRHSSPAPPLLAAPLGGGGASVPTVLCPITGCPSPYPGPASSYDAWSLDLAVRYYPAALSLAAPQRRLMVYLGEFVGYHRSTLSQLLYPPVPLNETGIPCSGASGCLAFPSPITEQQAYAGWEPGAEIGVRLIPLAPLFVDVGGSFRLVTVDVPTQRTRPGEVDARLVAAVGIGW
jgi:hypothetical protein